MTTQALREATGFSAIVTAAFFVRNAPIIVALGALALISLFSA
jgi:hypothetical protein